MFGFFKKKKKSDREKANEMVEAANKVIQEFSKLVSDENFDSFKLYDVSILPHEKETIELAFLLGIMVSKDQKNQDALAVILINLANFQEGIGSEPVPHRTDAIVNLFEAYKKEEMTFDQMASEIADMENTPDADFQRQYSADLNSYYLKIQKAQEKALK